MRSVIRDLKIILSLDFSHPQSRTDHARRMLFGLVLLLSCAPLSAQSVAASSAALKKLSMDELLDVEVTSVSKHPEKLSETASAIQVITQEDIRRSGATSIPEALRLASNLQVAQENSHDWAISARGFNTELSNKLLVMIDGRTIYTPLFSGVFWDQQDYLLEDIDRIEVISGPGGTLWGANAVNGVINIITKSAKNTHGLYAEAGGGKEPQDFAGARYGGALNDNVSARVYAKYFDRGEQVFANGNGASDSSHRTQGGFRIDAESSDRDTLTVQGDLYDGKENLSTKGWTSTSGNNVLARWSRMFTDDSDMSLQLYYDHTHLSQPVPPFSIGALLLAPAGTLNDNLDTYDIDFQHRFRLLGRHQIVWGLGYRYTYDDVENAPGLAFFPPVLSHDLFSAFVQDEIQLLSALSFTLGTKFEHNDYTGFEFEPNIRLQWAVTPQQKLWAAVSRAVRTPSRVDHDLSQPAPPHLVVLAGSSDFESETVMAYELGYRAQLNSNFSSSIALFYNDYDDLRSTSITPLTVIPFYFANNLKGETHGFELTVTYQPLDWWRVQAGYNLLNEHLRVRPGQFDLSNALNETADPQHQASLRSSMDLPYNVALNVGLRWVDTLHNNNAATPGIVPSYYDADVRLGWQPNRQLELSIVGQNLLHAHHPEYGFPNSTREDISRNVVGKVAWRF